MDNKAIFVKTGKGEFKRLKAFITKDLLAGLAEKYTPEINISTLGDSELIGNIKITLYRSRPGEEPESWDLSYTFCAEKLGVMYVACEEDFSKVPVLQGTSTQYFSYQNEGATTPPGGQGNGT
jgi:hypothetical protein